MAEAGEIIFDTSRLDKALETMRQRMAEESLNYLPKYISNRFKAELTDKNGYKIPFNPVKSPMDDHLTHSLRYATLPMCRHETKPIRTYVDNLRAAQKALQEYKMNRDIKYEVKRKLKVGDKVLLKGENGIIPGMNGETTMAMTVASITRGAATCLWRSTQNLSGELREGKFPIESLKFADDIVEARLVPTP